MHVCDRARRDCRRNPACTTYGDANNTVTSLRINMLARHNDTDYCGVYINDVTLFNPPFDRFMNDLRVIRLETKSCRILPLTYGTKCDMT